MVTNLVEKHWSRHERRLRSLLDHEPFCLAADFDGTICELAIDRPAAISPICHRALDQLRVRFASVAVISGRPASFILERIDLPGVEIFGIHGFERVHNGRPVLDPGVERWKQTLERAALELAAATRRFDVDMHIKDATMVVDWRFRTPRELIPELNTVVFAVAEAHGLAVMHARMSLELHPPIRVDKGTCLTRLADEHQLRGMIYLGDDHSDLHAFRAIRRMREEGRLEGLAFGVMHSEMPEEMVETADLVMTDVSDVERFLTWLCEHA